MNVDIRSYIINNFKDGNVKEIEESITESIKGQDELTLPGLGVFFEVLWNNSDEGCREKMLGMLSESIKNTAA